jgi:hypothetical protein
MLSENRTFETRGIMAKHKAAHSTYFDDVVHAPALCAHVDDEQHFMPQRVPAQCAWTRTSLLGEVCCLRLD